MSITVDYVVTCDGCHETAVVEYGPFVPGERPPACVMPMGWNGVDTGRTLCPKCSAVPIESPECGSCDHL